jgi:hypothetical protein
LAYLLDLLGEENEAVALYTELTSCRKPHINALVNLAVICEDRGELRPRRAPARSRSSRPTRTTSARRLFIKDVLASKDMQVETEMSLVGPTERRPRHAGHRFRAFRPRAQLPQEDADSAPSATSSRSPRPNSSATRTSASSRLSRSRPCCRQKGLRLGQGLEAGSRGGIRKDILDGLKASCRRLCSTSAISSLELLGARTQGVAAPEHRDDSASSPRGPRRS